MVSAIGMVTRRSEFLKATHQTGYSAPSNRQKRRRSADFQKGHFLIGIDLPGLSKTFKALALRYPIVARAFIPTLFSALD